MICLTDNPHGAEILTDYCAGTLDARRAAEIEAHLPECAKCKELARGQRMVWDALDGWEPVEVSSDFDAKLYARIGAETKPGVWRRTWWRRASWQLGWRPLLLPLAAAGAVLGLALLLGLPERTVPVTGDTAVRVDNIDIQQVQQALDDLDLLTPMSQTSSGKI